MSFISLKKIGDAQKKAAVVDVRSGDTVRVTQKIKEGEKFRSQVFEGVVIEPTARILTLLASPCAKSPLVSASRNLS